MNHDWKTLQPSGTHHRGKRDQVRTWRCARCGASVTISSRLGSPAETGSQLGGVSADCDVEIANRVMRS